MRLTETLQHAVDGNLPEQLGARRPITLYVAVALCVFVLGVVTLFISYGEAYDEGIVLSAGGFIHLGLTPYRDFYFLYGPGTPYVSAFLISIAGPSLGLFRGLGLGIAVLQGVVSLGLAASFSNRLVALLLAIDSGDRSVDHRRPRPLRVVCGDVAGHVRPASRPQLEAPRRRTAAGLLLGLAFLCRLDVGAYALIAAFITWRDWRLLFGFFVALMQPTIALVLNAPLERLVNQLLLYPLLGTRQFRGEYQCQFPGTLSRSAGCTWRSSFTTSPWWRSP